eukprot:scaffold12882_cov73-Skeletonema_marinoi.AAC.1
MEHQKLCFGSPQRTLRTLNMHHALPTTKEARHAAFNLRRRMIESGRIDVDELKLQLDHDDNEDILHDLNPSLAIERLYERRGKMFLAFGMQLASS